MWVTTRGVSGLRSVGLLRGDTKRFGDGDFFLPTKRNLNFNNQCILEGVAGLRPGGPLRRYSIILLEALFYLHAPLHIYFLGLTVRRW